MLVDVTAAVLDGAVRKGEEFGLRVCFFECNVNIDKILVAPRVARGMLLRLRLVGYCVATACAACGRRACAEPP